MFTCNCLIREDSKSIREELRRYGYKMKALKENKYDAIMVTKRAAVGLMSEVKLSDGIYWNIEKYLKWNPHVYDCGHNKELFLALSSCSDDHCHHTWFAKGNGELFFSKGFRDMQWDLINDGSTRRATKEQLISHFSK